MKIEERLHDALHEYADSIEPEEGSWARISARLEETSEPRPPRSHGRALVFAALAVVTVVVIAAALVRDGGDSSKRIATLPHGAATASPGRILVVNSDRRAAVINAGTGAPETGEYEAPDVAEGTQIAVNPDGRDVYLVHGVGNEGCADHSVVRLPVVAGARGGEQVATNATDPAVSPDGRYLAYLHCSPDAGNRADHIVLRDLVTGEERVTVAPDGTFFINRVEFAPDAHRVIFNLYEDAKGRATLHELDVVDGEAPPGREVGAAAGAAVWVGLRGQTGEYLSVTGSPPSVLSTTGFDASKDTAAPLFTLPAVPTQVVSDDSGRHILAIADHALYRWSVGDKQATKVADNVIGAAWIPDVPQAPPAPAAVRPSALPNGVVVARNGELDVLGASDGQQHSSLGAVPNVTGIGASLDGRELIYDSSKGPSPDCNGKPFPKIERLDTTKVDTARDAASRFVVGGAGSPAVSPDGDWVAYGIVCDGITPGYTNLKTGENYRFDPFPAGTKNPPKIVSVAVLDWAPDSRRLLYRLGLEGQGYSPYYVARLVSATGAAPEVQVEQLALEPGFTAATFIDDRTLAVASAGDTETIVSTFAPANEARTRLFVLPGKVTSLVADPSGRHLLALRADGVLYRWTQGDHEPVKVSDGVTAATWVPWS